MVSAHGSKMEASHSTVERVRALDSKEVEQTSLNPAKAVAILASCVDEPPIDSTWESVRREQGVALDRQLQIFRTLQGELDHVAEAATVLSERFPGSMLSASYRQVERMIEGGRKKRESRIIVRGKSAPSLEALKGRIDLLREGAPTEISNLERAGDSFFRVFKAEIRNFADSIAGVPEGVINRQCQRFSDMMGRVTPLVNMYNFAEADARGDLASTGLNVPNWGPNSAAKRLELSGGIALPTILLTANPSPGSPSLREILNQAMEENATARTLLDSLPKAAAFFSTNAGRWMVAILPSYKFLSSYVSGIHPVLSDGRDELALSSFDSSFTIGEYRAVTKMITAQDSQLGEEAGYILRELDKTAEVAGITGAEFDELPFPLTLARVAQAKHDLAEMVGRAKGEEVFLEFFKDNRELLTLQNEQYDQYAARVHGILKDLSGFPLGEKWSLSRTPERFRYAALDRTEQEAREIALQSLGLEEAEGLLPGRTYGELMKLSVIAKELQIGCGMDTGEFVQYLGERVLHRNGESYREDLMTVAQIGRSSPKGFNPELTTEDLSPGAVRQTREELPVRQIAYVLRNLELDWEPAELADLVDWRQVEQRLQAIPLELVTRMPELFTISDDEFAKWQTNLSVSRDIRSEMQAEHIRPILEEPGSNPVAYSPPFIEKTAEQLERALASFRTRLHQQVIGEDLELASMWTEEMNYRPAEGAPIVGYTVIARRLLELENAVRGTDLPEPFQEDLLLAIPKIAPQLFCLEGEALTDYLSAFRDTFRLAKPLGWEVFADLQENFRDRLAPNAIGSTIEQLQLQAKGLHRKG